MRASHRKVFLPLAKLQSAAAHGPGHIRLLTALSSESLSPAERRLDRGSGARESNLRADQIKAGFGNRGSQPVWLLSQRSQIHQPEAVRHWLRKSEPSLAHHRCTPAAQCSLLRALLA